ncbi:MAG: 50S ribosomal protein L15 [Methanobrevibacter sp.]|jgi:large subunit ribosomal protein L15|nr:50S ribosomal protein L15 [Methanobrevibacter sp.]
MIRKTRKINKMRGSRSIGGGCSKKRRGAGNKGGKGKAGMDKQHWTWTVKFDPNHFGKYGFKRPQKVINKVNPVNLSYLDAQSDKLLDKGIATKEGDSIVIDVTDLGYDKVLGKGNLSKALTIKSPKFSASAEDKIQEAGGEAITL